MTKSIHLSEHSKEHTRTGVKCEALVLLSWRAKQPGNMNETATYLLLPIVNTSISLQNTANLLSQLTPSTCFYQIFSLVYLFFLKLIS